MYAVVLLLHLACAESAGFSPALKFSTRLSETFDSADIFKPSYTIVYSRYSVDVKSKHSEIYKTNSKVITCGVDSGRHFGWSVAVSQCSEPQNYLPILFNSAHG